MLLLGVHKISVNRYLLNINHIPGTVLAKTEQCTKQVKILAFVECYSSGGRLTLHKTN